MSWLWSQLSSLTECTLDNQQQWTTLVRNDVPQVAIYQIVTFLWGTRCCKFNNLVVTHWLNIFCKRSGVSNSVIAISTTLTSDICLAALSSTRIYPLYGKTNKKRSHSKTNKFEDTENPMLTSQTYPLFSLTNVNQESKISMTAAPKQCQFRHHRSTSCLQTAFLQKTSHNQQ